MKPRTPPVALLAVVALAAALVLARLGQPDWTPPRAVAGLPMRYVWDEALYAFTAHRYAEGDPGAWKMDATAAELRAFDTSDIGPAANLSTYHPPLSSLVMAASIRLLGWTPFAVRISGALCGVVLVACTWLLVRRIRGERVATLAAALVAFDGVWFTISRIAMPHIHVAACGTAALYSGLVAWEDDARRARLTLVTGAICGIGIAFKETCAAPALLVAALLLVRTWRRALPGERGRALGVWAVAFLVLPPAIYLASWLPFFVLWNGSWDDFVSLHLQIHAWHTSQPRMMGPSTPWITWPVLWKPVRLFQEADAAGLQREIFARGNPFLWWAAVAAVPWAAVRLARRRAAGDLWIVAGYLVTWLPYGLVPRFGFSYYMLPAAPFAAAAVVCAIDDACGGREKARTVALWTYGALAAGAFAKAYPVLAAIPQAR